MSSMDAWIRQAAKPGGEKTITVTPGTTTRDAAGRFVPGKGAGEGGARGSGVTKEPSMDDWLRKAAGRRGNWDTDVALSEMGITRGHPDADGSINR